MLKNVVNEIVEGNKKAVSSWSINKILKYMKVDTVDEAIQLCINKIKETEYSVGTNWQGKTRLYYHIENENILLTLSRNDFDKNSKDRYYFDFKNNKEKLQVLFEITGELTAVEKLGF